MLRNKVIYCNTRGHKVPVESYNLIHIQYIFNTEKDIFNVLVDKRLQLSLLQLNFQMEIA